jgi:hypothetical protein
MPARSTPFQKLVLHLQEQLSPTATVAESAFLIHRLTGESREVDVVVRATVGEHPVVVSLECIEHGRPADVTWVEQMITKHAHLDTNRLVLVSLSGFSDQAVTLARGLGITTYTPEEACAQDWMQVVGQASLFCARHDYTPLVTSLLIDTGDGPFALDAGPDTEIFRPDTGGIGKLGDLVMFVLHDQAFASVAMDSQMTDGTSTIDFDFTLDHKTYATDVTGTRHLILGVHVKVKAVRSSAPVPMTSFAWNGVPAAFGAAQTPLGPTTMTIVEPAPGQMTAKVVVDGKTLPIHRYAASAAAGKVRFGTG